MDGLKRRSPAGQGQGFDKAHIVGDDQQGQYNPYAAAAAKALARELSVVLLAADRLAAGHGLAWSDHDRLHAAHQHCMAVLSELTGREVTLQ